MSRIKGVASQFAELLKAAVVDTMKELRTRNVENLYAKLVEVQEVKKIIRTAPELSQTIDYIEQAKELKPMITY